MSFTSHSLFADIEEAECRRMLHCLGATSCPFQTGEILYTYGGDHRIGLIQSGRAELQRIDGEGNRTLLELLGADSLYGEPLAFSAREDSLAIVGSTDGRALLLDYDRISHPCGRVCPCHTAVIDNLFRLLAQKSRHLSERITVISHRSIREKLLCYFRLHADSSDGLLELPFTLSALADYICADRSAMMRELKRMKEGGLLSFEKRRIRLNLNKP